MADIEKVTRGLECLSDVHNENCVGCGYIGIGIYPVCVREVAKDAMELLKKQEWISIKERYPDKEGFYLVSADHGNYLPWIAEMKIFCGVKGFCNGAAMPCVGAWMPLPEPYNRTD